MRKFELKVNDVSNLAGLIGQVSGTFATWKMAEKLEAKILLNPQEVAAVTKGEVVDAKGVTQTTYDAEMIAKTVELSDEEVELLKQTLTKLVAEGEGKKSPMSAMKPLLSLDTLLNEETETEKA